MGNIISDLRHTNENDSSLDPASQVKLQKEFYQEIEGYLSLLQSEYNLEKMIFHCRQLVKLLIKINSFPDLNEQFKDSETKGFFLEDFIPTNIQSILDSQDPSCEELEEILHQCLEQTVWLWLKVQVGEHPKFDNIVAKILDATQPYYTRTSFVKKAAYLTWITPNYGDWIKTLKEEDVIDCVKMEPTAQTRCWSHGKIIEKNKSIFKVCFLNDYENLIQDIDKAQAYNKMAPFKTKCEDSEWRMSLKKGDEIDVCDPCFIWYNATVLDTREVTLTDGSFVRELFIAYRVFREDGPRKDGEGRSFAGWSNRYDEWISATSSRISKINSLAKKLDLWNNWPDKEFLINDARDLIYPLNSYTRKVYAVHRIQVCKSNFLVNLLNTFGEKGGFEHIYNQVNNKKTWEDITVISYLYTLVKKMSYFFHREFALEYIPKLEGVMWKNIALISNGNAKDITESSVEDLLSALETLLLRVYSVAEKIERIDKLRSEICRYCFESQNPEIKFQGLKIIYNIIAILKKTSTAQGPYPKSARDAFHAFLLQNDIYAQTFISKDSLILENSLELLEYCFKRELIDLSGLEKVWANLVYSSRWIKKAFHPMFFKNLSSLKHAPFFEFIIAHLLEISPEYVTIEELDFVIKLSKTFLKSDWSVEKYLSFFWKVSTDDGYPYTISENAISELIDFLQPSHFAPNKNLFITKCQENIIQGTSVLRSLKVIRKLVDCSRKITPVGNHQLIEQRHFCKDELLLRSVINSLKSFKNSVAEKAKPFSTTTKEQLDLMIDDHIPFLTHISERIGFIEQSLLCGFSGNSQITYQLLEELWTILVRDAFIEAEVEIALDLFKTILRSKKASLFSYEDIMKFCHEKLESKELLSVIKDSLNGFEFLREIFILVNENLKNISQINVIMDKVTDFACRFEKLIREVNLDSANDDFKIFINVPPSQLKGVQTIWEYIFAIKQSDVFDKVADFIVMLYTRVNGDYGFNKKDTIGEYLDKCYSIIKDTLNTKSLFSEEMFTDKIVKCQKLILAMMDKTHKYDSANYRPHLALANQNMLQIVIKKGRHSNIAGPEESIIEMKSNNTMYNLFCEVAKLYNIPQKEVHLKNEVTFAVYKPTCAMLVDLKIQNNDVLVFTHMIPPRAVLVEDDGTLNPKVEKIFIKWFERNSDHGKMDPELAASFIQSCTSGDCIGDDRRVRALFSSYDTDRRGYLTLKDFLGFYHDACSKQSLVSVVWSNLNVLGERNDLKEPRKQKSEQIGCLSAQQIISSNEQFVSLLFSLLQFEDEIGSKALELLNRLPTNKQILTDIITLKGVRGIESSNKNWSFIHDSNGKYKFLYHLTIIECLVRNAHHMEDNKENEDVLREILSEDLEMLESLKVWLADFISCGGEEYLRSFKIKNNVEESSPSIQSIERCL